MIRTCSCATKLQARCQVASAPGVTGSRRKVRNLAWGHRTAGARRTFAPVLKLPALHGHAACVLAPEVNMIIAFAATQTMVTSLVLHVTLR